MKKTLTLFLSFALIFSFILNINFPDAKAAGMSVSYTAHIQTYGDAQGWVSNGNTAGTSGEAKRMEALKIRLTGSEYSGNIVYRTHVQTYGWMGQVSNGTESGTRGQAKRLEAVQISLTGEIASHYDITYRVHCQTYGWMDWVSNGASAGTVGQAKRLEAIQIKLVPKSSGNSGSGSSDSSGQTDKYLPIRQQIVDLCNQYRAQNNINNRLTLDPTLTQAADIRAKEIVQNFSHTRPDGTSCFTVLDKLNYPYRMTGENIASGYMTPDKVMTAWMNSPGHRANILNASFNKIGVGYYETPGGQKYYWVQMFSN